MGKAWAEHELKVARRFGTERLLQRGRSVPDFISEKHNVVGECKYRQTFSIASIFYETKEKYRKFLEGRRLVLVLKEKGRHGELVLLSLDDFMAMIGGEEDEAGA